MQLIRCDVPSPLGDIAVIARDAGPQRDGPVVAIGFADCWPRLAGLLARRDAGYELSEGSLDQAAHALERYFSGDCEALDAVSIDSGGTAFQRRVWRRLMRVPAGETISYAGLAAAIGSPAAARAVGTANATNPISLVVPCHRVVRTGGEVGEYSGGATRKAWLLRHEAAHAEPVLRQNDTPLLQTQSV